MLHFLSHCILNGTASRYLGVNSSRMPVIRITLLIVSILSGAFCCFPQTRIHGRVTDERNHPIEFATVRVAGTSVGVNTDAEGRYRLTAPAADTLHILFSCIGYRDGERKLVKVRGNDLAVNMKLKKASRQLREVQISEYKKQLGSMQQVDADAYRHSPDVTGGSVESMLSTFAGVTPADELSSAYSVRGGSYDENSVYVDGVELFRRQLVTNGQQEGLSVINPSMVDKLIFSTGGFPAVYSDKMSSALDITYRRPHGLYGNVSLGLMGAELAIGQGTDRFSQLHGLRYKRNASLLATGDEKGEYDPRYFDYQTKIEVNLDKRFKVSFLGNIALNSYRFTPRNRTTKFGTVDDVKHFNVYFDGHEHDKFETWFGALSLNYVPSRSSGYTLLFSGNHSNELIAYDITGEYWLDDAMNDDDEAPIGVGRYHEHARDRLKATVYSMSLQGRNAVSRHMIDYGVTLNHESVSEFSREWELRDSAGFSLPGNSAGDLLMLYNMSSDNSLSSNRVMAFLQDTYRIDNGLGFFSLNGGVRVSYWDFNRELLISPRLNIGYVPASGSNWAFRFATGLYYQSPFYKELRRIVTDEHGNSSVTLNKDIKAQRSVQFIIGSDYTFRAFNRPFKLSAEAYCKALSRLNPYEIDNLRIVYAGDNSSSGYAAGLDLRLFGEFVPGSDSWLSLSLMKSQETINGVKVPLPNDRRYSVALYFTDYFPRIPRMKVNLRGMFADGLPVTMPHSTRDKGYFRTSSYKRVDIGLAYNILPEIDNAGGRRGRFVKSMWVGVDCFNLFDISNVGSYYWVKAADDVSYAVPNSLTRRMLNVRLTVDF